MVKNYKKNPRQYPRYGGTAAKFPLQTTNNKPVKKIYKKTYGQKTSTVNKSAIMTLSKQVRLLQNQRAGEVQTHTQWARVTGTLAPGTPLLFGLNNFYDQDIYKGITVSQPAPLADAPSFQTVTAFARNYYQSDLADEYEWNARRNTDLVSTVEYKPIFTRLNFKATFTCSSSVSTGRLRITILKIKPFSQSNKLNVSLPSTLGAYRWLANSSNQQYVNYFDKTFHQVISDRWITVKPPAASPLTTFTKELRMDYKFDAKILKPDITATPADQNFWTNTSIKDQLWVLISCDGEASSALSTLDISKFDVWRDPHGV